MRLARVKLLAAGCALACLVLLGPTSADELRISPDDLRIRTAISKLLTPSLRLQLRDLAAGTPLPLEGGVVQTDRILEVAFADRDWDGDRKDLVRYYFLVARMEKSREFSQEFARRRKITAEGRDLMKAYLEDLNQAIARGVFVANAKVDTGPTVPFPLTSVGWIESDSGVKTLRVLHTYPEADTSLGRETLRNLRDQAVTDVELLETQISAIDDGDQTFISEIAVVGDALMALRPRVVKLVRLPRAGLPFSF